MKKIKTLLIFVDGLQFDESQRLGIVKKGKSTSVKPSIGFSNNIYPEMFCGKSPDEIGYFNEWYPDFDAKPNFINKFLTFFDFLSHFKYPNAIFRILILKKIFNKFVANIPFKYLHYFKATGAHNFGSFKNDSLLEKNNFIIFDAALATKSRIKPNQRDLIVIDEIMKSDLKNKNIMLSLMELDNISHSYGLWSEKYEEHLQCLDKNISRVCDKFLSENSEGNIFLFSDHGMSPVTRGVSIDLETKFGEMRSDRYLFFLDSTFLRVWSKDKKLYEEILKFLNESKVGHIIKKEEREKYGVTNKAFGDLIFRAEEGIMFQPNFFGIRLVKAMHGYDSELPSQFAVFADLNPKKNQQAFSLPKSSKEIFYFFKDILN